MKHQIEQLWQQTEFTEQQKLTAVNTIMQVLTLLDKGQLRVAEKINNCWQTNDWLKKAILLAFKLFNNNIGINSYDKIPLKFTNWQQEDFFNAKIRVVPGTTIRLGAYLAKNTIFMPCFINTGAFIDEGTLIDSGAVIGSCAQIGKRCHIASNAAIGGVLEPLQNSPTIIEDDCFIGVGSILAEGTIVEQGAVISMGVSIGGSTKIINRATNQIFYGKVPAYSVVIPGSYTAPNSSIAINCAVIVKTVDAKTRSKTGINELLREYASA
jgi:2,3,4,5-tetrahydropyridine-2,6-dicarboxylate N-succinyltransferase